MAKVKNEEPESKVSDTELRKSLQSLFKDFHKNNKSFSSSFSEYTSAENQMKSKNVEFGEAKNHSKKKNRFSNEFNAESKIGGSKKLSEMNVQNKKKNFPRNANKFTKSHVIYDKNDSVSTEIPKAAGSPMKNFKKHNKKNSDKRDNYNKNFNNSNVMNKRKFSSGDDNETSSSKNFNKVSRRFEKNSPSIKQDFPRKENKSAKIENSVSIGNKSFVKYGTHRIFDENDNSSTTKSKDSSVKKTIERSKKRKFSLISNSDVNNTEKYEESNAKDSNQSEKHNSLADFSKKKRKRMKYTDAKSFNDGSFIKPETDAEDTHKISNKSFTSKISPKEGSKFHTNVLDGKSDKKKIFPADFPRNKKKSNLSFSKKVVQSNVHKTDESNKSDTDSDDDEIESKKFVKEKNCTINSNSSLDPSSSSQSSKKSKSKHSLDWKLKREKQLQSTLFVGNLPLNTTKKDIKKLFSPFGSITLIRFAKGEHDGPKHWKMPTALNYAAESVPGFITFEQEQHASDALSLNGTVFKDHHITVNLAVSPGSKILYESKQSIFIGNLPFDVKDDNVWDAFSNCGKIQGVRLVRDKQTGIGKGFGYVQFHSVEARDTALALDDLKIQGRRIRIKPVTSDKKQQKKLDTKIKRDPFRSKAIRLKKSNPKTSSRKSIKKLMNREKVAHKKKKIAAIMKKAMK